MPGLSMHLIEELPALYVNKRLSPVAYTLPGGGGGGGGHSGTGGGGGGGAPALRISRKKGSFLRPPHVRDFVKEGYFFVSRYEVSGVKIPLQSTKYTRLRRRVTPEMTGLTS